MTNEAEAEIEENELEGALKRFLIETLGGLAIFAIIAGAAVLLSYFVGYLDSKGIDKVIIYGLKGAEYLIFFVDLVLLCRFLWSTSKKTWRKLK